MLLAFHGATDQDRDRPAVDGAGGQGTADRLVDDLGRIAAMKQEHVHHLMGDGDSPRRSFSV